MFLLGNATGDLANAYYLPGFYNQLINIAKEFPIWSAVMTPFFQCKTIRATSAPSEGHFNELKNRILHHYLSKLRIDKFFIEYWRAIQGTAMIAAGQLVHMRLQKPGINKESVPCIGSKNISNSPIAREKKESTQQETSSENESESFCPQEINSSDVDSDLHAFDNWRNKTKRDDPMLLKMLSDSPQKKKQKIDRAIKNLFPAKDNESASVMQNVPIVINQRKRTKYFDAYPEIELFDNDVEPGKKNKNVKLFLMNGSHFKIPHLIDGRSIIVRNTCPFDAIVLVQSTAAIDSKLYRAYMIEKAPTNSTFSFILRFIAVGGVQEVYIERAKLLMQKYIQKIDHQVNDTLFQSSSPGQLRVVDSFTYLDDIWGHLMKGEPSINKIEICKEGHEALTSGLKLYVNENVILEKGYQALEDSLLLTSNATHLECKRSDCACRIVKITTTLNVQIFVDIEVRNIRTKMDGNITQSFLKCRPTDIPAYITLQNEKYRLAGIIIYESSHFIALCRRLTGNWEVYNDLQKKKSKCKLNEFIMPKAAIYIKLEDK